MNLWQTNQLTNNWIDHTQCSVQWLTSRPDTLDTPISSSTNLSLLHFNPTNTSWKPTVGHSVRFWVGQSRTTNSQVLTEHSLGAMCHAKNFTCMIPFNPHHNNMRQGLVMPTLQTEQLKPLEVPCLKSGRQSAKTWILTQTLPAQSSYSFKFEDEQSEKVCFFKENWIYRGRLKKFFFPKALNLSSLGPPKLPQTIAHSRQGIHLAKTKWY